MAVLAFGFPHPTSVSEFYDVDYDDWYCEYVMGAYRAGIVNGMGNASFGAGIPVARQDMAVIALRAAELKGMVLAEIRGGSDFADKDSISAYALTAVDKIYRAGIIDGMGDGRFCPSDGATRAQAAKIIACLAYGGEG
jgi:hypothetical protein